VLVRPSVAEGSSNNEDWFDIGSFDEYKDGEAVVVSRGTREGHRTHFGFQPVVVARSGASVHVVSATCTHQKCDVRVVGSKLVCPCHNGKYTLDGAVLEGPPTSPLPAVPVKIKEGRVLILWKK
jgi:nitrite reductase/ring-hydroxylating ferredoxin subunit